MQIMPDEKYREKKMQLYEKICLYFVFEESTESIIIRKDAPAEIHEYFAEYKKFLDEQFRL